MLKTIVKKEILENIFSYRFPLFALICVVLIPLGMFVNEAQPTPSALRDYSEQVRLADEAAAALKIQDIMAGTVAIKGFRPPGAALRLRPGLRKRPAPLLRVHPGRVDAGRIRRAATNRSCRSRARSISSSSSRWSSA